MFSDEKDEITPAVALGGHLSSLRLDSRSVAFSEAHFSTWEVPSPYDF